MKTDLQLKNDILAELAWDTVLGTVPIEVSVKDGIVNLTGQVGSSAQKHALEKAVRRVAGVRGLAVDVEVKLAPEHERTDSAIARAALDALQWHSWVPHERVQLQVEDGWVTLSGEVDWHYQAASAEKCIRPLTGVRGVINKITVKPRASENDISAEITDALTRHARRKASHISVQVEGGVVTLSGEVDSLPEHEAALGAAWRTRGVSRVVDHISVSQR